ncbi:purine permease 1-like [Prosopis cineraria]|uniref:purine permease 1-like n=1 Tax=Prosopis cineraria TaxID=364024 RepID=UPI00240F5150|nr:purine permease 1-like [Prosopis cineraria]
MDHDALIFSFFTCTDSGLTFILHILSLARPFLTGLSSVALSLLLLLSSVSPPPSSHRSRAPYLQRLGTSGGPLISCLYFLHSGKRVWLSSWLKTGGFLVCLLPLFISFIRSRLSRQAKPFIFIDTSLFLSAFVISVLSSLDDYLYACSSARLPISTSALIIATQLAFTAAFAFLLVRKKFTLFSINAVVLLITGAGMLALHSSGDRP